MKIVDVLKAASKQPSIWRASWSLEGVERALRGQALALPFDNHRRNPMLGTLQLLRWLGTQALTRTLALARSIFRLLTEASADVGELFTRRHGGEA